MGVANGPVEEALMVSRRNVILLLAVTALLITVGNAQAYTSAGLHGGFSSSPDQFVIGPHLNLSAVGENLYIVPSGEVGFGDNVLTLAFNGDLQYRFVTRRSKVRPYAGGGMSVFFFDPDGPGSGNTNLGVNLLGGIFFGEMNRRPMFLDFKVGLTNEVPDWKLQFGFNF